MPRVLITYLGRRGGGAQYALGLARACVEHGMDVDLLFREASEVSEELSVLPGVGARLTVASGGGSPHRLAGAWLRARSAVAAYLRASPPDLVVVAMWSPWDAVFIHAARQARVPVLYTVHDAFFHPGERNGWAERLLHRQLRRASGAVALTDHVAGDLQRLGVAPVWVANLPSLAARGPADPLRTPRRLPSTSRLVLLGRMVEYKGVDEFIVLVESLRADGIGVTADLAGEGPALTEERVGRAVRADIVVTRRWLATQELESLAQAADLIVLPYREATQSGIVPLAFVSGVPVVATAVGGLPEQVSHGVDGLLVAVHDAAALKQSVLTLLQDPDLYSRLSAGALETAATTLGWQRTLSAIDSALATLARPE